MVLKEKIFKVFLSHGLPCRLDQICLAIFEEGQLVTISAKLFSILTNGFRGEDN